MRWRSSRRRRRSYIRSLAACVQSKQEVVAAVFVVKTTSWSDPSSFYPFLTEVGAIRLEYLDTRSLLKELRRTGKPFPAIALKPMKNWDGALIVDCADYQVSVRKGRVTLGVIGGTSNPYWRFDVATRDYVVTNVERWRPQM